MRGIGLCAVALLVVGCGGGQGSAAQPGGSSSAADLIGRTFLSTSVTEGGQPRELVPGTKVSLWFAEDGRLVANAGCNTMTGQVRLDGGKLETPDGLSMTEMGCDAPRHAQDEWLATLLQSGPSWRVDGDELVLTSGQTELVLLDRAVAEPAPPVEGTKWLLETIYAGETASSAPTGPYLIFADGRVTGSTGCNDLGGPATITGSNIEFGPINMTRKGCPDDLVPVEQAMVAVLQGTVPFEVEHGQLILNPGAQQGLGFRG
jgi:heat shock protein HslJ